MLNHLAVTSLVILALIAVPGPPAGAQEPIRVGFLTALTGALAQPGKEMQNGIELMLQEHRAMLGGRPIQLTVLDTASNPAVSLAKARELVEQRKVHVIIGPLAAFEAYAVAPYANTNRVPSISPSAAADDLTQRKATPLFVRVTSTSSQPTQPFGTYAAKTLGYKKIATIADDFAFGHEVVAGFQRAFEDAGGQIVQKLWPPLGTTDQSPYISQLKRDVDAVFIGFAGIAALRFLKQYQDTGLKGRIPVLANQTAVDEALLRSMGDEALGVVSTMHYSAALDTPANRKFVAAYRQAYGGNDPGLLLGRRLYGRPGPQAGARQGGRPDRGHRRLRQGAPGRGHRRRPRRTHPSGPARPGHPQRVHPPRRAQGWPAAEHRDSHVRKREPVLELSGSRVPQGPAVLRARTPVQELLNPRKAGRYTVSTVVPNVKK